MLWDAVHPGRRPAAAGRRRRVRRRRAGADRPAHARPLARRGLLLRARARRDGTLFSGDTLFHGGPGATGRSFSSFPEILESIRTRLLTLPAGTAGAHRPRRRDDDRRRGRRLRRLGGAGPLSRVACEARREYPWGRGLRPWEVAPCPDTPASKDDYLTRLRRVEGQVRGLQRMVERGHLLHRRADAGRGRDEGAAGGQPRAARGPPRRTASWTPPASPVSDEARGQGRARRPTPSPACSAADPQSRGEDTR